jgi:hypothetical protein
MSLYRTTSAAQVAGLARSMALEKNPNTRARYLHHILQGVLDLDRAAAEAVDMMYDAEDKEQQLKLLAEELGMTLADPRKPLTLPGEG